MGNAFLDKPITQKKTDWAQNNHLKYAVCEMQGWRRYMEDAYIAYLQIPGYPQISLFGVFDGHGGGEVSKFVANHFLEFFVKRKALSEGRIGQALAETFVQVQLALKSKSGIEELLRYKEAQVGTKVTVEQLEAGATAVVVALTPQKIICANAGDSRAALYQGEKVLALSQDHKPEHPGERARIEKTGVPIMQGRVNGLNLTRSIGDFKHKQVAGLPFNKQPITCMPDIVEVPRTGKEEILLVGCDGIWQKFGEDFSQLTLNFREGLKTQNSGQCLKSFFDRNINPGGGTNPYGRDNMTAILVQFLN